MKNNAKNFITVSITSLYLTGCINNFDDEFIKVRDSQPDWQIENIEEDNSTTLYRDNSIDDSKPTFFARFREIQLKRYSEKMYRETTQIYVVNCQKYKLARIYTHDYEESKLDDEEYARLFEYTYYNPLEKNSLERLFQSFEFNDDRYQRFCAGRNDNEEAKNTNELRPDYTFVSNVYETYPHLITNGPVYVKISDLLNFDLNKEINIVNVKSFIKVQQLDVGVTSNDQTYLLNCAKQKSAKLSIKWRNLDYEFSPNPDQSRYSQDKIYPTFDLKLSELDEESWSEFHKSSLLDKLCDPNTLETLKAPYIN